MSKNAIYDTISVLIICVLIGGLTLAMIFNSLGMPDVHISHSTGECVEVINYDERFNYTCENYPEKYNHIWVE